MIDVTDASLTCDSFGGFPPQVSSGVGGLLANQVPIICGGTTGPSSLVACMIYDKDTGFQYSQTGMLSGRGYAAGVPIKDNSVLFVSGGHESFNQRDDETSEYASLDSDTVYGPDLPYVLGRHCMAAINESTLILTGGSSNEESRSQYKSWYFDVYSETWTEGPEMNHEYGSHGCAVFIGPGGQKVVAVANGSGGRPSQLLFLDEPDHWIEGTSTYDNWVGFSK